MSTDDTSLYGRFEGELILPGDRSKYYCCIKELFYLDILEIIILIISKIWMDWWLTTDLLFDRDEGSYFSYRGKIVITKYSINDQNTLIEPHRNSDEVVNTADFDNPTTIQTFDTGFLKNYSDNSKAVIPYDEPLIDYVFEGQIRFRLPDSLSLIELKNRADIEEIKMDFCRFQLCDVPENVKGDSILIIKGYDGFEFENCQRTVNILASVLQQEGCVVISRSCNEIFKDKLELVE